LLLAARPDLREALDAARAQYEQGRIPFPWSPFADAGDDCGRAAAELENVLRRGETSEHLEEAISSVKPCLAAEIKVPDFPVK
jgi:hypothetical protein